MMDMKTIMCLLAAVCAVNATLNPEDDVANLVNWKVSTGVINSAIHKAGSFTVHGRSTGLPGIIPVEQKSVHWLSMGAARRNDLQRSFCMVAGRTAAL